MFMIVPSKYPKKKDQVITNVQLFLQQLSSSHLNASKISLQ